MVLLFGNGPGCHGDRGPGGQQLGFILFEGELSLVRSCPRNLIYIMDRIRPSLLIMCFHICALVSFSAQGGGLECCYDDDGVILNVALSDGGGYSYRYHQDGVHPYDEPSKVVNQITMVSAMHFKKFM